MIFSVHFAYPQTTSTLAHVNRVLLCVFLFSSSSIFYVCLFNVALCRYVFLLCRNRRRGYCPMPIGRGPAAHMLIAHRPRSMSHNDHSHAGHHGIERIRYRYDRPASQPTTNTNLCLIHLNSLHLPVRTISLQSEFLLFFLDLFRVLPSTGCRVRM